MSSVLNHLTFERRASENSWLDLIRAFAILLVLLRHGQRAVDPQLQSTSWLLGNFFLNGWVGVDLFFVLSGYLIASHLIRSRARNDSFDVRRYFAGRALRIAPAYFATIALIIVGAFPFYRISGDALSVRVAYHLLFLQDYLPSNLNVAFWSLGVEEKFYLAAPALVWVCLSRRSLWQKASILGALATLSTILRAIAFAGMPDNVDYGMFFVSLRSPFHLCLEPLLAGVAVAMVHAHGVIPTERRLGKVSMAAAMAALLLWLVAENFMYSISWRDIALQPILLAGLFALLVHGAVLMGKATLPFEPVVRIVARLSYTLYLVHIPIIPLALAMAGVSDDRLAWFWILYLTFSMCAALLLHYLIEKPFLLLKLQIEHGKDKPIADFPDAAAAVGRSTVGMAAGFLRNASNDARL